MSNKAVVTELYPKVEEALSRRVNEDAILKIIGAYVDRNMEKLSKVGPVDRVVFETGDSEKFVEAVGLTPEIIKTAMKNSSYIDQGWHVMSTPFYTACTLAIRYYSIKGKKDKVNILSAYLCFSMYPLIHFKYFKYGVNENVMAYTIANLSNKYKFKQLGSLYATLVDMSEGCFALHKERITKGTDKDIVDFINDMHSRLNDRIKNVNNEYYPNHASGNYLNIDSDNIDEENYHEADNNSYLIDRCLNNVMTKLVVQGPNMKLVNMAAKLCGVSVNELRNYSNVLINDDNRDVIKDLVEAILYIYIFDNKKTIEDVKSHDFLVTSLDIYKKSNSNDKNVSRIKSILDEWVEDLDMYKKTQRVATINSFRKAIYTLFVLTIQNLQ